MNSKYAPSATAVGYALLALRVSVGSVLLGMGILKLQSPADWLVYVPAYVGQFVGADSEISIFRLLRLLGLVECLVGSQLILGLLTHICSAVGAALLFSILVHVGFSSEGVRDLGLLGGLIAVLVAGPGFFALDSKFGLHPRWRSPLQRGTGESRADQKYAQQRNRLIIGAWTAGGMILGLATLAIPARNDRTSDLAMPRTEAENFDNLPIPPLPQSVRVDRRKAELGRKLFLDPRLSKDNTVSCAFCHRFNMGGADGRRVPVGIAGQLGEINSPTVFNSGYNFRQFWDGRAATLEEQAGAPVENPIEMGAAWPEVVAKLRKDTEYVSLFAASYPGGINKENALDAIASFERALLTPNSPFDRFLRGDKSAMSDSAKRGYEKFESLGCISCHQGKNIGGTMFQTMGKMEDWFAGRTPAKADLGRFNVTGNPSDKHKFKVPSLRNIELTGPYFHDGSAESLEQAVRVMARYQLGYRLNEVDVQDVTAFLRALTGELPTETQFTVSFAN